MATNPYVKNANASMANVKRVAHVNNLKLLKYSA